MAKLQPLQPYQNGLCYGFRDAIKLIEEAGDNAAGAIGKDEQRLVALALRYCLSRNDAALCTADKQFVRGYRRAYKARAGVL